MDKNPKHYYVEYITIEHQVKVTAIDPESGIEATVICPATATQKELSDLAIKKLKYVIKKRTQAENSDSDTSA